MKAFPIPVQTKIVDNLNLSVPWQKWFQELGNNWISSCTIKTKNNFNYNINGSICFFTFTGTTETIIDLPYTVLVDSVVNGVILPKGSKSITLSIPTSGFYFTDL